MQTETSTKRTFRWHFREDRWLRRGLYLAVAALFVSAIINIYSQLNQRGEAALMAHTERLARLILAQAQHEARIWFLEENEVALESLARHLQQQDEILEVAIQDEWGQTIVRMGHDLPVHEYLQTLPDIIWAVPMVEPVLDRDGAGASLLGFVRITFDYDRIMAESRPFHRTIMSENAYLMLMAFFSGLMVAAAFIRRRKPVLIRGKKHGEESSTAD
ncbi:MAG: putative membrane protein affecting hemolysin expression [Idiomarinaceae bacterium HL-53]|nr:MAG: putative membrane protein affecting hemolysin expression [Idiomarinaceae bacterium HL-53]